MTAFKKGALVGVSFSSAAQETDHFPCNCSSIIIMNSHSHSPNNIQPDTSIESKLQGVAAAYRRERDEAYRSKQLALERLNLTQQEANAVKQSVASLFAKLEDLKKQSGADALQEIETIKQRVQVLTHQVRA